ncbi:MAG: hypothetical protein AB7H92_15660 [Microbacteriaceae bacterium]
MSAQLDLLAVADNPQPWADEYRQRIVAAIKADAAAHDWRISTNRVRAALSNANGLTVDPRMLSATYSALAAEGRLESLGYLGTNDDTAAGNAGKPQRHWRWVA